MNLEDSKVRSGAPVTNIQLAGQSPLKREAQETWGMAERYALLSHGTAYALMKELDGLLNMGSFGHAYFIHVECWPAV